MREGWEEKTLMDLGFVGRGKSRHRPRNADFLYGDEYPFVQTADVKAASYRIINYSQMYSEAGLKQSKLWPRNTLCVTIAANIADAAILSFDACFPDSVIGFIADYEKSDVRFVKYSFNILQAKIKKISQGAAQDNLSLEKLETIKFLVPPLSTQKKIADILSAYDDLIENNLKRIQLLEEQAQLMYEEWFVRMKFPGNETAKINEETGLPEGWENSKLEELIEFQSGFAYKSERFCESGFPIVKIKNISNNAVDLTSTDFIDNEYADSTHKFQLNAGDLVIAMTGATVGKVGLVPKTNKPCYLNQRVGRFLQKGKTNNVGFVNYFFSIGGGLENVLNIARGAAQPNISASQILSIPILKPSTNLLKIFSNNQQKNIELILNLQSQNRLLQEARDLLLPRLMMGMIDVEEERLGMVAEERSK